MRTGPAQLRCNEHLDPQSVDTGSIRLSWWPDPASPTQTACEILAASVPERLEPESADLWRSGRVSVTNRSVPYEGEIPGPLRTVWWCVRGYDAQGRPGSWSAPARFRVGGDPSTWAPGWIESPLMGDRSRSAPVVALRRRFRVEDDVHDAVLAVAVRGAAVVSVNGQWLNLNSPISGWTDFRRRAPYRTFDVGAHIRAGDNLIGVLLADGYAAGAIDDGVRQRYCERAAFSLQLATFRGDSAAYDCTRSDWAWRPSSLVRSDPMLGDIEDQRQRVDWASGHGWYPLSAPPVESLPPTPVASIDAGLAVTRRRQPKAHATSAPRASRLYDFEEHISGRIRVEWQAAVGSTVRIEYGEHLDAQGNLDVESRDEVTTAEGAGAFNAVFAVHSFRYARIRVLAGRVSIERVTALVVGRGESPTAEFDCDHPLLNQLFGHVQRTQHNVFLELPFAGASPRSRRPCPEDALAFMQTGLLNRNDRAAWRSWLAELRTATTSGTTAGPYVPAVPGSDAGSVLDEVYVRAVWTLYCNSGDRAVLAEHYAHLRHCLHDKVRANDSLIVSNASAARLGERDGTPADLIATAYLFQGTRLAARIATELGRRDDIRRFAAIATRIGKAFRRRFVTADGRLVGDTVAAYALALQFDLVQGAERAVAAQAMAARIEADGYVLQCHPFFTDAVLRALCDASNVDLAYSMLLQTTPGSWLYGVLQGATTCWDVEEANPNGTAAAGIGEWLVAGLAGIDLGATVFRDRPEFHVRPHPPVESALNEGAPVNRVAASVATVSGWLRSAWTLDGHRFNLLLEVPPNSEALVLLPDGTEHRVGPGEHEFNASLSAQQDDIPVLQELSEAV